MAKYHLNKKENEITNRDELQAIIKAGKYTTLSLCRDNEPYIVTLNYGFDREKQALYFHTSTKGLKIDFIKQNPLVCGTIIEDKGYQMGKCDHAFRSVVFWGTMLVLDEMDEKKYGMDILLHHLEEEPAEVRQRLLADDAVYEKRNLAILRLDIHDITGKTAG